jgi:hypothetical protein
MWGAQKKNKGDESAKEANSGDMPPWFYLPTHPEARLTEAQVQELSAGLERTFGKEDEEMKKIVNETKKGN